MTTQTGPINDIYRDVGVNLRRIRGLRGMSLVQASEASGGQFTAIGLGSHERGDRRVQLDSLYMYAEFYDVPVSALLPSDGGSILVPLDSVIAQLEALRGEVA